MAVDFVAEGLTEGLEGDELASRLDLLEQLHSVGVPLEALKTAVAEERLALLPLERAMAAPGAYTAQQVAKLSSIDADLLLALRRSSGLPVADPDAEVFSDDDVETARSVKLFLDADLSREGLLEAARVLGEGAARGAAATRTLVTRSLLHPGQSELDVAMRLSDTARALRPLTDRLLAYLYHEHMREQLRNEIAISSQIEAGKVPGLFEVSVCFVDLVGFTTLGETIEAEELGSVASRLGSILTDVVEPPVRLTKMIGDAGMLVCEDTDALLEVALTLIERTGEEELPELKAGAARGEAIHRWGDWYGSPVNVASRVTTIARPGSVLVTKDIREQACSDYRWSFAGRRRLKGVKREVALYRARRNGRSA